MTPLPVDKPRAMHATGSLAFRAMKESDMADYCALFKRVFASAPWNEKWSLTRISRDISKLMRRKGFIGFVAIVGDKSVGFIAGWQLCVSPKIFYLSQLFIDDTLQGKGAGTGLLHEIIQVAKDRGFLKMVLLTKPKSKAYEFYSRNGFNPWRSWILIKGKRFYCKNLYQG